MSPASGLAPFAAPTSSSPGLFFLIYFPFIRLFIPLTEHSLAPGTVPGARVIAMAQGGYKLVTFKSQQVNKQDHFKLVISAGKRIKEGHGIVTGSGRGLCRGGGVDRGALFEEATF